MKWLKVALKLAASTVAWLALAGVLGAIWWTLQQDYGTRGQHVARAVNLIEGFEYWLNRYQTLLTGLLALGAAWYASIPVKRQLREMSRQTAASVRPAMIEMVQSLEEELDILRTTSSEIASIGRIIQKGAGRDDEANIYPRWLDVFSKAQAQMARVNSHLIVNVHRTPDHSPLNESRKDLIDKMGTLSLALEQLQDAVTQQTQGLFQGIASNNRESDLMPAEISSRRQAVEASLRAWNQAHTTMFGLLASEIKNAWKRLRELERYSLPHTG